MADAELKRHAWIYAYSDPETGEIHYIGRSVRGLYARLHRRLFEIEAGVLNTTIAGEEMHWIGRLVDRGLMPIVDVLEEGDWTRREMNAIERRWIAYGNDCGWPLFNKTTKSAVTRARMSAASLGVPKSPAHCAALSAAAVARWARVREAREEKPAIE